MEDLANVTAAILAGGLGTRLSPVIGDQPKVLAEVHGRPFLAYLLDQLSARGVQNVVLCTGHMGGQIQALFGFVYQGLRLVYSQESSPRGTAGALRMALDHLESDSVLVMNGDSFCQADLKAFRAWHSMSQAEATLFLAEANDSKRYGRVDVDADGRVLSFVEKDGHGGPGWINAGIYLFRRRIIETIPANRIVSLEREILPAWIPRGLYVYRGRGRFLDIGTPEAYAQAEQFFGPQCLFEGFLNDQSPFSGIDRADPASRCGRRG